MFCIKIVILFVILLHLQLCLATSEYEDTRYLLYGCNPGEGFNLRRDVYIRISNLVKYLDSKQRWTLVLPPWGGISYHWNERNMEQSKLKWSRFFHIPSLQKHVHVIEFEDYVEKIGDAKIDEVWYLQEYEEGVDYDNWEDKADERPCVEPPTYETEQDGKYRGWFWGYDETYAIDFKCVSVQGNARVLSVPLLGANTTSNSVMLDRAEQVLHDTFGGKDFWDARRSMVFSKTLQDVARKFREKNLDSNDVDDKTEMPEDWRDNERRSGDAIGTIEKTPFQVLFMLQRFLINLQNNIKSTRYS